MVLEMEAGLGHETRTPREEEVPSLRGGMKHVSKGLRRYGAGANKRREQCMQRIQRMQRSQLSEPSR